MRFDFHAFVVFESLANLPSAECSDVEFQFSIFITSHLHKHLAETAMMLKQRYLVAHLCTFARDLYFQSTAGRLPDRGFKT